MPSAQTHLAGDQTLQQKPLQEKNFPAKKEWIEILAAESNKENCCNYRPAAIQTAVAPPVKVESLESSLAEELSAVRKKMERLRQDKLRERDRLMDIQLKEMEVDKLFRLNELRSYCMRISLIRSLRLREKKINGPSPATGGQDAILDSDLAVYGVMSIFLSSVVSY